MYIPDLSQDAYFMGNCPFIRSIGWLGKENQYSKGDSPSDLIELLQKHLEEHWACFAAFGLHDCEICVSEGKHHMESTNLFIPAEGVIYFAPGMIVHYIQEHQYAPPAEFVEAVRKCPKQGGEEFMDLMKDFLTWLDQQFQSEK